MKKIKQMVKMRHMTNLAQKANGANEDGTTFPGLGKIDYVLTEASVKIISIIIIVISSMTIMVIMIRTIIMIAIIIMINLQSIVTSAAIDRNNYGDASDHLPINAVLQM